MDKRFAREIGVGPRHFDDRQLERETGIAALAVVLEDDGEEVDQPQHRRLRQLVRLFAEAVP